MVTVNENLVRDILERLVRLETLVGANAEETNRRIDDTNKRIDDTNKRIDETNKRIDETNARITENTTRIDSLSHQSARQFDQLTARIDRLFYTIIGLGAAVIAALVAGQVLD